MRALLAPFVLIHLAIGTPSAQEEPSVTLPPELGRVLSDYESAWRARDAAALSRLFADDALVLAPGSPVVRGRESIEAFYQGQGGPLFLRALAYAAEGRLGYVIGAFTYTEGDPDRGKFTLTLRKDGSGRWLIVSDMDNGNSNR
jgi:ketosteroid isomerase-like protein